MENELLQLTVIAVVLAPITTAVVQMIKTAGIPSKLNGIVAIVVGVALAGLWVLTFGHTAQVGPYLLAGLLSGLSSSGLYDLAPKKEAAK